MFGRRTEDRGPIRRYKKGRSDVKRHAGPAQPLASNVDAGITSQSVATPSSMPMTGSPVFPPSASLEAELISDVSSNKLRNTVIAALVLLCIGAVAVPLITIGNTIRSIDQSVFPKPGPSPPPVPASPTAPAKQVSYLTAAGARIGLAHLARLASGARVSLVRIDATSITATAQLPGGASKLIAIEPTGVFTQSTPATGEHAIPISQIPPKGVARIVAEMKRRFHVTPARIDYMVLSSQPGLPVRWIVFSKAGGHPGYTANLSGGHLVRLP